MSRAEQAAARLQRVKQLAERHGPALRHAFGVLLEDALIGPAGDRLFQGLAERHRDARSAFYAAFDAVERLAAQAEAGPPRLGEPYIPGPPRGGRRAPSDVRGGSPDALHRLGAELGRAGREWQDAGDALARILDGLGLSTSPAHSVSRAGRWVAAQQHDVHRRRDELIKADQQQALQAALGTVQGVARALGRPRESRNTVGIALNKTWNDYTRRYLPGVWTGTKDIGLAALASNPVTAPVYALEDWDSWLQRGPVGQVKGVVQGVQHPIAFAKAMIDWDEWKKDPLRAFGKTVPTLVISAVTFGTGTGANAGAKAGTASTRFGKVQRSDTGRPDGEPASRVPQLSREALAELQRLERRAQEVAGRHGVRVDFSRRPIDPANAAGFTRALERVAADYPSVFRAMENIRIQNLPEMRATDPHAGPNVMGYSINDRKGPVPQGVYFNQDRFLNKADTDALARAREAKGWSVPGGLTAEGTFLHEFGHQIGHRILADPRLCRELAAELRKAGLSVDDISLHPGFPHGAPALQRGLSAYGRSNPSEMIAEAFAEWKLSSHPRPIASAVGGFIDKHFKGK